MDQYNDCFFDRTMDGSEVCKLGPMESAEKRGRPWFCEREREGKELVSDKTVRRKLLFIGLFFSRTIIPIDVTNS